MTFTIEDVNSRTLLQQFHSLYKRQQETDENVSELSGYLEQEIQDRTTADAELSEEIASIQSQLDSLGNIFTLKGSVQTIADLPATDNHIGDVYYVVSESTGYVWIDDNGTERWEQLGISVDLSNYVTQTELETGLSGKQNSLTAGTNISIIGDTISATQPDTSKFEMLSGVSAPSSATAGAVGQKYLDATKNDIYVCIEKTDNGDDTFSYTWLLAGGNGKQNKLTAGTNISIDSNNVISASGGSVNLYEHRIKITGVNNKQALAFFTITNTNSNSLSSTEIQSLLTQYSKDFSGYYIESDDSIRILYFISYNAIQGYSLGYLYIDNGILTIGSKVTYNVVLTDNVKPV